MQELLTKRHYIMRFYYLRMYYSTKLKPVIVSILYRLPDTIDFVIFIDQIFSQFSKLETQECYLLGDFNINFLFQVEEIFSNKISKTTYKEMPTLTKKIEFCSSNFIYVCM